MATREIPREQWREFLDGFSRAHESSLATLEVVGRDVGAQVEARELPLVGVSYDDKGSGADSVEILLGLTPDDHLTHVVPRPQRLWVMQDDDGADQALDIEDRDDHRTLLRFRVAARPEALDGVLDAARV